MSWNAAGFTSDSGTDSSEDNPSDAHSSEFAWRQYCLRRKPNENSTASNSNAYHKYQRNVHPSKSDASVGSASSRYGGPHKRESKFRSKSMLSKHMHNKFNTHIVPNYQRTHNHEDHDHHNDDDDEAERKGNNEDGEGDNTLSPFLRVQQNKRKMPYSFSNSSLASMASMTTPIITYQQQQQHQLLHQQHQQPQTQQPQQRTPSDSSTTAAVSSSNITLLHQQLQQQQFIRSYASCMKSTQCSALSSLMFTTPQRVTYFQQHRHLYFRHEVFDKLREQFVKQWRAKDEDKRVMRTTAVIVALCLNIGVDPPDVVRTDPCAVLECWLNPSQLPASRALQVISTRVQQQYQCWGSKQSPLQFKEILDGNPEQVRQCCLQQRQQSTYKRVIFHYNGHGVPKPTPHGELWFFNGNYSEYLPVSVLDIAQWLQTPAMLILDCSNAGKIVTSYKQYEPMLKAQAQKAKNEKNNAAKTGKEKQKREGAFHAEIADTNDLYRFETMLLAACGDAEELPMNPQFPADIFTSCLTSPIKMALKWFISTQLLHDKFDVNNSFLNAWDKRKQKRKKRKKNNNNDDDDDNEEDAASDDQEDDDDDDEDDEDEEDEQDDSNDEEKENKNYEQKFSKLFSSDSRKHKRSGSYNDYLALLDLIFDAQIGGSRDEKKSVLGELHWIFLSITDTIAWNVLPNKLFQNLFRLDYTIQSLFRNYLLAERIMRSMNRTPVSYPALPPTYNHPMWHAWDIAVDAALLQLKEYVNKKNQWKYQQIMKQEMQQQQKQHRHDNKSKQQKKATQERMAAKNQPQQLPEPQAEPAQEDGDMQQQQQQEPESFLKRLKVTPQKTDYFMRRSTVSDGKNVMDAEPKLEWQPSQFFDEQLQAFELWINSGEVQKKPYHLPIVLQALLNKQHRLKALTLLARYLDFGPWTVNYVLWVGFYSYFKVILKQAIKDDNANKTLRYALTFIWAKILAHDPSARYDLIVRGEYAFFYKELKRDKDNSDQQIFLCTFILAQIAAHQPTGQKALVSKTCGGTKKSNKTSLLSLLSQNIFHANFRIKIWSILCVAKLWQNNDDIKSIAYDLTESLLLQLASPSVEVRAATMYALGTFFDLKEVTTNATDSMILGPDFDLTLAHQLSKLVHDPSPIIRMELVFVLSSLVYYQQEAFREFHKKSKELKKQRQPSLQSTSSLPPTTRAPGLSFGGQVAHSATTANPTLNANLDRISPMIQPIAMEEMNKDAAAAAAAAHNDQQQYEQRKRIWEVIKVLCKDPIAEISQNAKNIKDYVTNDRVRNERSRALSDPEKHAQIIKQGTTLASGNSGVNDLLPPRPSSTRVSHQNGHHHHHAFEVPHPQQPPQHTHSKANTILGALTGIKKVTAKKKVNTKPSASVDISPLPESYRRQSSSSSQSNSARHSKKLTATGKSAFIPDDLDECKEEDPNWSIPDSPLFSWLTEYISRPLTNAMYDSPDPLYHELDPKNLPLIDPRLTMTNFIYHQEQEKNDEELKLLQKKGEHDDENAAMSMKERVLPMSTKFRYIEMNSTLAMNYVRLAAIRSWQIRKFYTFEQRAKTTWKQLVFVLEGNDIEDWSSRKGSMPFTLPSMMMADTDSGKKVRSMSTEYQSPQIQSSEPVLERSVPSTPTRKAKILNFLGKNNLSVQGNKSSNKLAASSRMSHSLDDLHTPDFESRGDDDDPFEMAAANGGSGVGGVGAYDTSSTSSLMISKEAANKFSKTGMKINNRLQQFDTECDKGVTATKFHPFRDIVYCADANGRVWVYNYSNASAYNGGDDDQHHDDKFVNDHQRINSIHVQDTHLSNMTVQQNHDEKVVVTSFEVINPYHDSMLLCAADDGTIRIYRNSHLENSMSAVTAFLANARVKPTRSPHPMQASHGRMITNWCSELGLLYTAGSVHNIKVHDCGHEAYIGHLDTKSYTSAILTSKSDENLVVAACSDDNKVRMFDIRYNLNTSSSSSEIAIKFGQQSQTRMINLTQCNSNRNQYYICSTQELQVLDIRTHGILTKIAFKKYMNTFDSHQHAPIYALGSIKQLVRICSSLQLSDAHEAANINDIQYHDGFLGARIGPVRLVKFHPYKLLLAVGSTTKHLTLYSSNTKTNSFLL